MLAMSDRVADSVPGDRPPQQDDALVRAERAYRAVITLPGPLGAEVCELVESQYELAGLLRAARVPREPTEDEGPDDGELLVALHLCWLARFYEEEAGKYEGIAAATLRGCARAARLLADADNSFTARPTLDLGALSPPGGTPAEPEDVICLCSTTLVGGGDPTDGCPLHGDEGTPVREEKAR
jgi:hypothetical protein